MSTQKVTSALLLLLKEGNTIIRYPCEGKPVDQFDKDNISQIHAFKIESINSSTDMMELIIKHAPFMYASPGDINHLFIKSQDIVLQKIWWIEL
ncbi:hypothetical protein ACTJIJ_18280 [Niabella sp. 22666]|uniref:hypothetical protein n=1 Tax=Niabella sp. 22666 TaxID=3453954 RepID=UPI003F85FD99